MLKHNDALAMWRGVSAGRGGRHQDEAGAHHLLLLLHHGRARSRVGALQTVLKAERDDSQNQRARITFCYMSLVNQIWKERLQG